MIESSKGEKEMNLSTVDASQDAPEGEQKRSLNSELWHACAGPLVCLPTAGTRVVYFPQGHSEQVAATTNRELEGRIPNYPSLPPHLFCQLHNVTMHADAETDEVFAQMTLQPLTLQEQKETFFPIEMGVMSKQPTNYFCKTLTASDTSTHGGFSVPRRAAEKVFPPLDFSQQPPAQELIARDLHDVEWKFRHVYRGQPKRHLLTTGWSVFVSSKRLVAGDSVLFIWNEKNQLLLGIRRANRQQTTTSSSVLSSDSMHIGLLAAAAHAAASNSWFTVFYNPRASPSEFIIPLSKYVKAVFHTHVSVGMRFRMLFETEECSVRRYMGTITGISDLDPVGWPSSHWRSVKVGWDESTACERRVRVSLWDIEPLTTFPMYPFPLRLPHPLTLGVSYVHDTKEAELNDFLWLRNGAGAKGLPSCNFPSVARGPWVPQRLDSLLVGNELNQYHAMSAGAFEDIQGGDITKQQFLQNQQSFQFPKHSLMISPFVYHQDAQQALQQQIIYSGSQCLLEDQPNSVQHQQLQQAENGNQRYNVLQAHAYDDTSQNSNHMQQQPTLPFQYEKVVFPDTNLIFSSAAPSSSTHGVSGFTYLKGHTKSFNCSQLDQSIICHQSQHSLDSNLTPFDSGAMLPSFAQKDSAVVNQNIPGGQNHTLKLTMDATVSGASSASHVSSCVHTSLLDESSDLLQNLGEVGPHCQTFVKVYKSGSVGRSLDISRFSNYDELRMELSHMFGIEGLLEDPLRSGWQLVFVDRENDVLLLGDDPWESFVNNVWYIKILSPEDVHNMGNR